MSLEPLWPEKIDFENYKGVFLDVDGCVGKVCCRSHLFPNSQHPSEMEVKIMKEICRDESKDEKRKKYQRFLPTLLYHSKHYVTDSIFHSLPMRKFKKTIHPEVDLLVVPRYNGTLSEYRKKKKLSLEDYRYIVFGILYTLYQLEQKYKFVHNDLHIENVLIEEGTSVQGTSLQAKDNEYTVGEIVFNIPTQKYTPILWDFETSRCFEVPHLKRNLVAENEPDVRTNIHKQNILEIGNSLFFHRFLLNTVPNMMFIFSSLVF